MTNANAYDGFWTDHGQANFIPAQMVLQDRTLFITLEDGRSFDFPRSLVHLSAPVMGGRRVLRIGTTGQIEVANDRHLDEIFPIQSTSLLSRLEKLERREWVAWAGALLLPITLALGFQFGVPVLARGLASSMPQTTNDKLSNAVLASMQKSGRFLPSRIDRQRQREIEYKLKHILRDRPIAKYINLQFWRGDGKHIGANAMALPNGTIVVTDQLIQIASNDSQILAVLGHEVGHIENRHSVRQSISNAGLTGMIALVTGSAASELVSASMVGQMANMSYSRDMETEADRYSFKLLRESRINPKAFGEIMQKIADADPARPILSLLVNLADHVGKFDLEYRNTLLIKAGNQKAEIIHQIDDAYTLRANGEDEIFFLPVGESIDLKKPFAMRISRRPSQIRKTESGYFSSHPATADRVLEAERQGAEFERTGK